MTTSWHSATVELFLKTCAGIESSPEGLLLIVKPTYTGLFINIGGYSSLNRVESTTTSAQDYEAYGEITITGVNSIIRKMLNGYLIYDEVIFDKTGISVSMNESNGNLYFKTSIEFTR